MRSIASTLMDDCLGETANLTLRLDVSPPLYTARGQALAGLWEILRLHAVEPSQGSEQTLASFADDCLLFAVIFKKPTSTGPGRPGRRLTWRSSRARYASRQTSLSSENDVALPPRPPCHPSTPIEGLFGPATEDGEGEDAIGLIYLHIGSANARAEANVGVMVRGDMQRRGYAREAMEMVLARAFEEFKFHRVQAAIMDVAGKDSGLLFFTAFGFTHEGTRRRSVYHSSHGGGQEYERDSSGYGYGDGYGYRLGCAEPEEHGAWKDVTYLAMLDTEWVIRKSFVGMTKVPTTLWDEMLERHARECDELIDWDERHGVSGVGGGMARSASVETVRRSMSKRKIKAGKQRMMDAQSCWGERSTVDVSCYSTPCRRPNIRISFAEEEKSADGEHPSGHEGGRHGMHAQPAHLSPDESRNWEELTRTLRRQHISGGEAGVGNPRIHQHQHQQHQSCLDVSSTPAGLIPSIPSMTPRSELGSEYPLTIPSPVSVPPDTPSSAPGKEEFKLGDEAPTVVPRSDAIVPRSDAPAAAPAASGTVSPNTASASPLSQRRLSEASRASSPSTDTWTAGEWDVVDVDSCTDPGHSP